MTNLILSTIYDYLALYTGQGSIHWGGGVEGKILPQTSPQNLPLN